jgi:hypothetical protein
MSLILKSPQKEKIDYLVSLSFETREKCISLINNGNVKKLIDMILNDFKSIAKFNTKTKKFSVSLLASHILSEIVSKALNKTSESEMSFLQKIFFEDNSVEKLTDLFNEENLPIDKALPTGAILEFYENISIILAIFHSYKILPDEQEIVQQFLMNMVESYVNKYTEDFVNDDLFVPCSLFYKHFTLIPSKRLYMALCAFCAFSLHDENFNLLEYGKMISLCLRIVKSLPVWKNSLMFVIVFFYYY